MCFNYAFSYTCHEKWVSAGYNSFVWDSRNIKGLRYVVLESISGIFLCRNTSHPPLLTSMFPHGHYSQLVIVIVIH